MRLFKIGTLLSLVAYQSFALADVNGYFNSIKTNPSALYSFLKAMPKGGELHYHLAGGAYPETMLDLAEAGNYCLDKKTFILSRTVEDCSGVKASELKTLYPSLYADTIRAWSMKNFVANQESNHDHFFASFYKFMPIVFDYRPELLAEIMQRAANQHELYLEIMILPDNGESISFAENSITAKNFPQVQKKLLADKAFQDNIQHSVDEASRILEKARQNLDCDKKAGQEVCKLRVKFQYYTLREQSLEKVFAQALHGFAAATRSKDLVGVNLVQAEDGIISLRDYRKQMEVFDYLHKTYPGVHIALHAGELAPADVTPEDLGFHIHDAIKTGHADRIGHGTDISFENNAEKILNDMAKNNIAVEINLISNKTLLHVSGRSHPLNTYLAHKVPVVLSTDDEGILRTDLTRQYVEAVVKHGVDYPTLKKINRNALTYSFLPGESIWANADKAIPVKACQNFKSQSCLELAKTSEKAELQLRLENKLADFEKSYTNPSWSIRTSQA